MTASTEIFATRYKPRGARETYLMALVASGAGCLVAITTRQWGLLVPALGILAVAERIRPYLGERDQIRLDAKGMTLSGLGFLAWREVRDARAFEHTTGDGRRAWLMLELAGDVEERVAPDREGWRALQVKPWRRCGGKGLIVRLEGLQHSPDAVRQAFEKFLHRRIAVDRV